MGFEPTLPP